MITNKTAQLRQDLGEVKEELRILRELFEDVANNCESDKIDNSISDIEEKFEILEEHLKDHLETIENFISDIN